MLGIAQKDQEHIGASELGEKTFLRGVEGIVQVRERDKWSGGAKVGDGEKKWGDGRVR
jgi:hypothetical protein